MINLNACEPQCPTVARFNPRECVAWDGWARDSPADLVGAFAGL